MENFVTRDKIISARKADLYQYLLKNHYDEVEIEGNSIRLGSNHSISIKVGYNGYYDFATGESGNAIDCLTRHFGYTFVEAVNSLIDTSHVQISIKHREKTKDTNLSLSELFRGISKNMFAYLTKIRLIPREVIEKLMNDQLIYQESTHNNIVFINKQKTFGEIHGTNSFKSFHGILKGSDSLGFWWFKSNHIESQVRTVYICESAIDAISLYWLHQTKDLKLSNMYCSIAGVANQKKIDLLKRCVDIEVVLAVDNDSAGNVCRRRNAELKTEIPMLKDWNDDWRHFVQSKSENC